MKNKLILLLGLVLSFAACRKDRAPENNLQSPAASSAAKTISAKGVCSTIQSFSAKEGKRVGTTFIHTIEVSYSVKPCNPTQNPGVNIKIYNFNTGELEFEYPGAPLSGKVLYAGAQIGLHRVVIESVDLNTGTLIESQQTVIAVTSQGA